MTHWECIEALARKGVSVHIDYDRGYGIDKRSGWSVTLDGSVVVQFAPTLQDAILDALARRAQQASLVSPLPPW